MYNFVYIGLFILLHIVDVSVQAVSCPTSRNQPVNITRVTDSIFGVTWFKNDNTGSPVANALYNSTTGGCLRPSNSDGYTTYCEKFDNSNDTLYTLEVLKPTEGDVYFINGDANKTTIMFPDCSSLSPEAKIGIGVAVALVVVGFVILVLGVCFYIRRKQRNKGKESKQDGATNSKTETSPHRGEIIIDENVEYVSQGGIFSDTVQYAVVNKKPGTDKKKDEIIIDENLEYVSQDEIGVASGISGRSNGQFHVKRGEEGLKYVDVDFSNQKPATEIRGANRQSTVQYSQIQPKQFQH